MGCNRAVCNTKLSATDSDRADAIVVGGGIGGLAAAVALNTIAGLKDVHVYERSDPDSWSSAESSTGLSLFPNGMAALQIISPEVHRAVLEEVRP
jgi:2-polyprenyl-6-methoxyphenol hydroxylase-like FAD-dependent oxidoreductase